MRYQRSYTLSYALLILMTLFAPETYGVSLKYVFVPLALMLLFGLAGKGFLMRLKFKSHIFLCLCWLLVMIYSTLHSEIVGWTPNARSFCILVAAFALLYEVVPNDENVEKLKTLYIGLTLFCALWVILQSFGGIDRKNFQFITGKKDVNYLSAFMLPGMYMAMRYAFLEKRKNRKLSLVCVFISTVASLLLQSRASFITFLLVSFLCFCEYVAKNKLTRRTLIVSLVIVAVVAMAIGFLWNSPTLSRLTNAQEYEEDVRLVIWEQALEAYRASPIIGSGLGASNAITQDSLRVDTHNNFVDILGDSGIVGMCLFLILSWRLLKVPKGERLHMFAFYIVCLLPLGFINGLQTISFWLPMLLLAHEHKIIQRSVERDRNNHIAS